MCVGEKAEGPEVEGMETGGAGLPGPAPGHPLPGVAQCAWMPGKQDPPPTEQVAGGGGEGWLSDKSWGAHPTTKWLTEAILPFLGSQGSNEI